jgi:hypothetical protein
VKPRLWQKSSLHLFPSLTLSAAWEEEQGNILKEKINKKKKNY